MPYSRINQLIRYPISLDVVLDFVLMIAEVTQSVEHLRKREVGQMNWDLFGPDP